MKKKTIAVFGICLLFVVSIVLSVFFYVEKLYILFSLMIGLYGVSLVSVAGLAKYRAYMNSRIIDPKRHLKRNYAMIYLGVQNGEAAGENTLDLRGYSRNFYVDTLLVQRYYSFLAADGTIKVFAGKNKQYVDDKRISPLDYPLLHPVTLLEHGIKPCKYFMFHPLAGLLFVYMIVFGSKRKGQCSLDSSQMADILNFCNARGVQIEII